MINGRVGCSEFQLLFDRKNLREIAQPTKSTTNYNIDPSFNVPEHVYIFIEALGACVEEVLFFFLFDIDYITIEPTTNAPSSQFGLSSLFP